jgi:phospholipid/cholesterol/gamma-HCH transport system substrate-binding protein
MRSTTRNKNIISGLIAVVLVSSAVILGIARSFGSFDDTYLFKATFDSAGQGLQKGSDVKIRGVNVGRVQRVSLSGNEAVIAMDINRSEKIPRAAELTVRPKTLFGEKFVDITPDPEGTGIEASTSPNDFYPNRGTVQFTGKTTGGFELERVLTNAYPLLKEIKPEDIMTVLSTLADAGDGLGPQINRQITNSKKLADVFAAHDADQRQFFADLDALAAQLGVRSDDIVALAKSLNAALPTLNSRQALLDEVLRQTARLSNDVSDLLENNKAFIDKSYTEGLQTLDILYDQRGQLVPLVSGLASYAQWLSEVVRIPLGDGTYMAAVRSLLGKELCGLPICTGGNTIGATSPTSSTPALPDVLAPATTSTADQAGGPAVDNVVDALFSFLVGLGQPR